MYTLVSPLAVPPPPLHRRRGFTVTEVLVAMTIFAVAMAAITRQLIESASITLTTSRLLEYSRNGRNLVERLNADVRSAQAIVVYPEFSDRSSEVTTGNYGNHLVLQRISAAGTISATIGYYTTPIGSTGTHRLHRYEVTGATMPATSTSGTHAVVIGTLRLPSGVQFFRNWSGRGVSVRGQYGTVTGASTTNLNYIQCTLTTRS